MSDSLRDQLLQAGFSEKKTAPRKPTKKHAKRGKPQGSPASGKTTVAQSRAARDAAKAEKVAAEQKAADERKRIKSEIKSLIEASALKDVKGELTYSYVLGKKVRQLFVTEAAQQKLSSGEAIITRLNGSTYLIPESEAAAILALNPDWAIVNNADTAEKPDQQGDDYTDFQVPDDLMW